MEKNFKIAGKRCMPWAILSHLFTQRLAEKKLFVLQLHDLSQQTLPRQNLGDIFNNIKYIWKKFCNYSNFHHFSKQNLNK